MSLSPVPFEGFEEDAVIAIVADTHSVVVGPGIGSDVTMSVGADAQVPAVVSLTSIRPMSRIGTLVLAVVE